MNKCLYCIYHISYGKDRTLSFCREKGLFMILPSSLVEMCKEYSNPNNNEIGEDKDEHLLCVD